ncbi:hypothetical protein PSTT_08891 [Puccinia striiformis]|uniref:Uncharacterized protein n=1 Tax=Puccinia striiformis TaxID=27350 RepID=A0A2S4VB11_9BASI|nr:hypothetical protein PSTT_08891 [Puccinia striiformis]
MIANSASGVWIGLANLAIICHAHVEPAFFDTPSAGSDCRNWDPMNYNFFDDPVNPTMDMIYPSNHPTDGNDHNVNNPFTHHLRTEEDQEPIIHPSSSSQGTSSTGTHFEGLEHFLDAPSGNSPITSGATVRDALESLIISTRSKRKNEELYPQAKKLKKIQAQQDPNHSYSSEVTVEEPTTVASAAPDHSTQSITGQRLGGNSPETSLGSVREALESPVLSTRGKRKSDELYSKAKKIKEPSAQQDSEHSHSSGVTSHEPTIIAGEALDRSTGVMEGQRVGKSRQEGAFQAHSERDHSDSLEAPVQESQHTDGGTSSFSSAPIPSPSQRTDQMAKQLPAHPQHSDTLEAPLPISMTTASEQPENPLFWLPNRKKLYLAYKAEKLVRLQSHPAYAKPFDELKEPKNKYDLLTQLVSSMKKEDPPEEPKPQGIGFSLNAFQDPQNPPGSLTPFQYTLRHALGERYFVNGALFVPVEKMKAFLDEFWYQMTARDTAETEETAKPAKWHLMHTFYPNLRDWTEFYNEKTGINCEKRVKEIFDSYPDWSGRGSEHRKFFRTATKLQAFQKVMQGYLFYVDMITSISPGRFLESRQVSKRDILTQAIDDFEEHLRSLYPSTTSTRNEQVTDKLENIWVYLQHWLTKHELFKPFRSDDEAERDRLKFKFFFNTAFSNSIQNLTIRIKKAIPKDHKAS